MNIIPELFPECSKGVIAKEDIANKLTPLVNLLSLIKEYMKIHSKLGFQFDEFQKLLKPTVEFIDPSNAPFYMKIIESVIALVKGNIDDVQKEFFILLKINPNEADDI